MERKTLKPGKDGTAPWRAGIPERFKKQIADQQPLQAAPLIEYLSSCNSVIQRIVGTHIQENGPLQALSGKCLYDLKRIQCTDSRAVTMNPNRLLQFHVIHKRIAGNVTTKGTGLRSVAPYGTIIVEGHKACGGLAASYDYEKSLRPGDSRITMDPSIYRIISSVPQHVRLMRDDRARGEANAIVQAFYARQILNTDDEAGGAQSRAPGPGAMQTAAVCPSFYSWTSGHEWLGSHPGVDLPRKALRGLIHDDARLMTEYALAEGRDFSRQYTTVTMLYDPYRLGRVNDPRAIFGALGNEMFCVTTDFNAFNPDISAHMHKGRIATPALGSVMYAGYDAAGGTSAMSGESAASTERTSWA